MTGSHRITSRRAASARWLHGYVVRLKSVFARLPAFPGTPAAKLQSSTLFDSNWYVKRYPDVAASGTCPLRHYLQWGADEGRDPGPHFSTRAYLSAHPDLEGKGINPLLHYLRHGGELPPAPVQGQTGSGDSAGAKSLKPNSIRILDIAAATDFSLSDPHGIAIIIPSINLEKAHATAELLLKRAGMPATVLIAEDTVRQGFITTLNQLAERLDVKYLVYTAEDGFPGVDWLKIAYERLEESGKSLLAFNCGKWRGRIAAFGMVRMSWVKQLYGGPVFYPGYQAHKADNELTVIARVTDQAIYEPDAVLVEVDPGKVFVENVPTDRTLFRQRFRKGFDGLIDIALLEPLAEAYFVDMQTLASSAAQESCPSYLATALSMLVNAQHGPKAKLREKLIGNAQAALTRGPYSVTDKTSLPPSGNRQDYWHPAPYWWPNPDTPDGLPYVRRDGERVPGTRLYEPKSEAFDRTRLQRVFDDSLILALAGQMTGEAHYALHGARILDRFFLNRETAMNPHLKYGQVRMGHDGDQGAPSGLIEMKDIYFYLDAIRMLDAQNALETDQMAAFHEWLGAYLGWLLTSPQGLAERQSMNNHGTCYDLQTGAIAAFLGDTAVLDETFARARTRIGQQFDGEGRQPEELSRTSTAHYCCFNLQSWVNLANLAERWDVDLWNVEAPNGASLRNGARWLLGHMGEPWPYEQIDAFDTDRFLPVWFAAQAAGVEGLPALPDGISGPLDVKPVFFPHDGIRPYWNVDFGIIE